MRSVRPGGLRFVRSGSEALLCSGCLRPVCSGCLRPGLRLHLVLRGEELLPAEVPLPPPPVLQVLLPSPQELLCESCCSAPCAPGGLRSVRVSAPKPCCAPAACALLRSGGLRSGLRLHLVLRGEELLPAEVPLPSPPVLQVLLPSSQELLCRVLLLGALCAPAACAPCAAPAPKPCCAPAACAPVRSGGLRSGLRLHLVLRGEELLPAEVPLPPPPVLQVLLPASQELLCGVLLLGALLRPGGLRSVRSRLPAPCALRSACAPACGCTSCCEVKSCCPRKCRCHHRRSCCAESCCSAPCCAGHLRSGRLCSLLWLRRDCSGGDAGCGSSGSAAAPAPWPRRPRLLRRRRPKNNYGRGRCLGVSLAKAAGIFRIGRPGERGLPCWLPEFQSAETKPDPSWVRLFFCADGFGKGRSEELTES